MAIRLPGTRAPSWTHHTCLFFFSCIPFKYVERPSWLYLQNTSRTQSLLTTITIVHGPNHLHPVPGLLGLLKGSLLSSYASTSVLHTAAREVLSWVSSNPVAVPYFVPSENTESSQLPTWPRRPSPLETSLVSCPNPNPSMYSATAIVLPFFTHVSMTPSKGLCSSCLPYTVTSFKSTHRVTGSVCLPQTSVLKLTCPQSTYFHETVLHLLFLYNTHHLLT